MALLVNKSYLCSTVQIYSAFTLLYTHIMVYVKKNATNTPRGGGGGALISAAYRAQRLSPPCAPHFNAITERAPCCKAPQSKDCGAFPRIAALSKDCGAFQGLRRFPRIAALSKDCGAFSESRRVGQNSGVLGKIAACLAKKAPQYASAQIQRKNHQVWRIKTQRNQF